MLKGHASLPKEEITLPVSLNMGKIKGTNLQRSTATKRESIREGLLNLAPRNHLHILLVLMMREYQENLSPRPREQRRRRSTSQEARLLVMIMKTQMVRFPFQDSLGISRANIVIICLAVYQRSNFTFFFCCWWALVSYSPCIRCLQ